MIEKIIDMFKENTEAQNNAIDIYMRTNLIFSLVSKKKKYFLLKNIEQNGGAIEHILIDKKKYYYNTETAIPTDIQNISNSSYTLKFITLDNYKINCALILFDKKKSEARIQSLSNYDECIVCESQTNIVYKVGDILMQIILHICKKMKVKKISLQDNSNKQFTGCSVGLIYFRTMTKGLPYYCKFGFVSESSQFIVRSNKKNFELKPKVNKVDIISILKKCSNNNVKYIRTLEKELEKYNQTNIEVADFLNNLFNLAIEEEKKINILREEFKNKSKPHIFENIYALIICIILKDLYMISKYIFLPTDTFILYLL